MSPKQLSNHPVTITDHCRESNRVAQEKGWYLKDVEVNIPEKIALMHSELSEALEEYRSGVKVDQVYFSKSGKPEGIPIELADVLIRIFDFCGKFNIDLESAIRIKMEYNETRPVRHGGKVC